MPYLTFSLIFTLTNLHVNNIFLAQILTNLYNFIVLEFIYFSCYFSSFSVCLISFPAKIAVNTDMKIMCYSSVGTGFNMHDGQGASGHGQIHHVRQPRLVRHSVLMSHPICGIDSSREAASSVDSNLSSEAASS